MLLYLPYHYHYHLGSSLTFEAFELRNVEAFIRDEKHITNQYENIIVNVFLDLKPLQINFHKPYGDDSNNNDNDNNDYYDYSFTLQSLQNLNEDLEKNLLSLR